MKTVSIECTVNVQAPAPQVWAGATDWDHQGAWMLGTRVRGTARRGQGVGGGITAVTGLGPLRVVDTMTITRWDPPRRCDVRHTGRVVRGTGVFAVHETGPDTAEFLWSEQLELPFGVLGRAGWILVRPAFMFGVRVCLRRFARWVEASQGA